MALISHYVSRFASGRDRYELSRAAEGLSGGQDNIHTFPWDSLTPDVVAQYRDRLLETHAPATARRRLAAIRGLVTNMAENGVISPATALAVKGVPLPPQARRAPQEAPRGQFEALAKHTPQNTPKGVRDRLILLLLACGVSTRGVIRLRLEDIGSGVAISDSLKTALGDWLAIRGDAPGALLRHVWRGGKVGEAITTTSTIKQVVVGIARLAGVPAPRVR